MTMTTTPPWEAKRTDETRMVEKALSHHFHQVDAYRYNSATIRLRVIDKQFEGKSLDERDRMVEEWVSKLPEDTQRDIITLLCFSTSELDNRAMRPREAILNLEFEDPSPSML